MRTNYVIFVFFYKNIQGEKLKTASGGKSKKGHDILILEKKDVLQLIKLIKAQTNLVSI